MKARDLGELEETHAGTGVSCNRVETLRRRFGAKAGNVQVGLGATPGSHCDTDNKDLGSVLRDHTSASRPPR